MSRIVLPFVAGGLRQEAVQALSQSRLPFDAIRLDAGDDGAYAALVEQLWAAGETFILVEQDVVPTRSQLLALARCHGNWCSYCYAGAGYPRAPMLGCVKFGRELLARRPEVGQTVLLTHHTRTHHVGWRSVNETLSHHLWTLGETWHRHHPDVVHLHPARHG